MNKIGFRIAIDGIYGNNTEQAVRRFQLGWSFRRPDGQPWNLLIDGYAGPVTAYCMKLSADSGGKNSPHTFYKEFASPGNHEILAKRDVVRGLCDIRDICGQLKIISSYRDPAYNTQVGGTTQSQHKYGNAIDIEPFCLYSTVRSANAWSGIGVVVSTGRVAHVDMRHLGPNTTGASPTNPTVWGYLDDGTIVSYTPR